MAVTVPMRRTLAHSVNGILFGGSMIVNTAAMVGLIMMRMPIAMNTLGTNITRNRVRQRFRVSQMASVTDSASANVHHLLLAMTVVLRTVQTNATATGGARLSFLSVAVFAMQGIMAIAVSIKSA